MMLPASVHSAPNSHVSQLSRSFSGHHNTPEEDDETMSTEEREASGVHDSAPQPDGHHHTSAASSSSSSSSSSAAATSPFGAQRLDRVEDHRLPPLSSSFCCYQPPCRLPAGYSQPTPFPSQADGTWLHPSFASSWSGYPNSLPSSLDQKDQSFHSSLSGYKSASLPGRHSPSMTSLEQPLSLCSNPPSGNLCHHTLSPYSCPPQGAACCAQCPADVFNGGGRRGQQTPLASVPPGLRPVLSRPLQTSWTWILTHRTHRSG
ncbi:uncharacterized protein traf3ip2l [Cebidichthys violaceus]|uniref:uncharacterized protein traf3ip2l n=1 Tax=Cebidichthys violaceus TaxID=271503 RepID=UPI0035C99FC7